MRPVLNIFFVFLLLTVGGKHLAAQPKSFFFSGRADIFAVGLNETITDNTTTILSANIDLKVDLHLGRNIRLHGELKNHGYFGAFLKDYPGYTFLNFNRYDWVDLNRVWNDDTLAVSYSRLDQAWVHYRSGAFEIRLGRQIINWSQTLVWNVSDIFNTYTLTNIHNPVKQGSDALRLSWYPGPVSMVEFAAKLNYYNELTAAIMYRLNHNSFDFQMQTGVVEDTDWMFGGGLVYTKNRLGARSDFIYYIPYHINTRDKNTLLVSAGMEYVFTNDFLLQVEMLYNQMHNHQTNNLFRRFYNITASPKVLSVSEWNLSFNASYNITNPLKVSLLSVWFIDYEGYTIMPSMHYDLFRNTELLLSYNSIVFDINNRREKINVGTIRLKYYF